MSCSIVDASTAGWTLGFQISHNELRVTGSRRSPMQRSFSMGDTVFAQNFAGSSPKWLPGSYFGYGPPSYQVQLITVRVMVM